MSTRHLPSRHHYQRIDSAPRARNHRMLDKLKQFISNIHFYPPPELSSLYGEQCRRFPSSYAFF
ncbi:hypothetical protein WAI453_012480 [Rhynchosporium graminicola]